MSIGRFLGCIALVVVALCASCGSSLSDLGAKGVKDLKCPEDSIEWAYLENAYRAKGCGREAFYHKVCRASVGPSCAYENVLTGLRGRASFSMGCEPKAIEIRYLDGLSYGVAGCGKRLVFAYDCGNDAGCTWRQEAASPP
jgi:hypothetical protein